jgi:hypothetical protein
MKMKITAKDISDSLISTHRLYGWRAEREALFSPRRIDVLAIKPFGSSVIAYEIKVSRSDFRNEMKDPTKRAVVMACSSEFYFVVPIGLLDSSEVPPECGLLYFDGYQITLAKASPKKQEPSVFECLTEQRRIEEEAEYILAIQKEREWDEYIEAENLDVTLPEDPSLEFGWLRNCFFPTRPLVWSEHYHRVFAKMHAVEIPIAVSSADFDEVTF